MPDRSSGAASRLVIRCQDHPTYRGLSQPRDCASFARSDHALGRRSEHDLHRKGGVSVTPHNGAMGSGSPKCGSDDIWTAYHGQA